MLGPRVREGASGYHLVTPLVRTDGSTILVNRGFVSKDHAGRPQHSQDNREVDVTGVLRMSESRNRFTPDNQPEKNEWYWADVDAMAEYAGGMQADVQPVLVDEVFGLCNINPRGHTTHHIFAEGHAGDATMRISKGIPVGRSPTVDLRNAHMSYVITW
jgi:surfeit locus 1 family protein